MISCQFENGDPVFLRHIAANAIVVKNRQVLLGKRGTFRGKKIQEYGKWSLIGGFMDRDEDLETCIRREVLEESGWEIDDLQLFRINSSPDRPREKDRQNIDIIFVAKAVKKVGESDEEVTSLKWFEIDKFPSREKIAFDHADSLDLYRKYLKEKFRLPIWGRKI